MDPADFISLAVKLSNSDQESSLRTAVSRAYYGVFHSARGLLEECGIGFPRTELFGADIHRKVRFCFAHAGNESAKLVANRLSSLREQRNDADYDLETKSFIFSNAKSVKTSVRIAVELVNALEQCRSQSEFRERVRSYAHEVLALPLDRA